MVNWMTPDKMFSHKVHLGAVLQLSIVLQCNKNQSFLNLFCSLFFLRFRGENQNHSTIFPCNITSRPGLGSYLQYVMLLKYNYDNYQWNFQHGGRKQFFGGKKLVSICGNIAQPNMNVFWVCGSHLWTSGVISSHSFGQQPYCGQKKWHKAENAGAKCPLGLAVMIHANTDHDAIPCKMNYCSRSLQW